MKIVLIGSGGFLGRTLFRILHQKDADIEWHLLSSSLPGMKDLPGRCFLHTYSWPACSLADEVFADVFSKADVIIYAAGAGIQPGENSNEDIIFNLNLFEPARLVRRLTEQGFRGQFITFGSYFETGENQERHLLNEESFLCQVNPLPNKYCHSKKELTHFHFVQSRAGINFKWLHLILTNIYGPGENGNRLIPYIISQTKQGLPLHFTAGSQVRQYTYVADVASVVAGLLGKGEGLYHVTNEEILSVKTIIEETVQQARNRFSIDPQLYYDLPERRDTAMDFLALSSGKLQNEWKLSCPTSYKEGISFYFQ